MPAPNSKQLKAEFDDAAKTYKDLGPDFAVRHVIEKHSLSAEDIALAWLAPEALDAKSSLTEDEKKQFDAQTAADKKQAAADAKAAKDAGDNEDAPERAMAPKDAPSKSDFSGQKDMNPADGGNKMPPVGGGVEVKSPAHRK